MKFIFIDETGSSRVKDFFGVGVVSIDSTYYSSLRQSYWDVLRRYQWQEGTEFKGAYMFSSKKGDLSVGISDRINMVSEMAESSFADQNSRMKVAFGWNEGGKSTENYLALVKRALSNSWILNRPQKKGGKHLCVVYVDYDTLHSQKRTQEELVSTIKDAVRDRGYMLVEDVVTSVHSTYYSVGISYADLISYLLMWMYLGKKGSSEQRSLFEEPITLNENDERKLTRIEEILEAFKRLKIMPAFDTDGR